MNKYLLPVKTFGSKIQMQYVVKYLCKIKKTDIFKKRSNGLLLGIFTSNQNKKECFVPFSTAEVLSRVLLQLYYRYRIAFKLFILIKKIKKASCT